MTDDDRLSYWIIAGKWVYADIWCKSQGGHCDHGRRGWTACRVEVEQVVRGTGALEGTWGNLRQFEIA
jgi:hypothetical protein